MADPFEVFDEEKDLNVGPIFTCWFDGGECGSCCGDLVEGARARYVDGDIWHAECYEENGE